ncbi:MAG TPA: Coenzyme F420 hydrogenase/dehydrogenase, beta subunit C-terminal domain [Candidatus Phocaeicola gallistercoris]|nr:Coenzyme F420 hydrogenase/dehydrogenase, beta subunit C-terminal domain [Candidatus Phocaeicola gallistercoris]
MITITQKQDCCGCNACVQICPKQCITMQEDEEGFLYPHIDRNTCVDCHLCEKTCPVLNQGKEREPLKVFAAINKDEKVRMQSSSGGIFTALAEYVIKQGGVVFGARFDEQWQVKHDYTETMEGLATFRGSKYVQSQIGNTFQETEQFLKAGRKVLFSGTPCQIAGLLSFLRKEYDNLLTVDFICHGVPSPMVWRRYLKEEVARQCEKNSVLNYPISEKDVRVEDISFRNKRLGWKKYSFALTLSTTNGSGKKIQFCSYAPITKNEYLRGFLSNVFLRPSCYSCPVKSLKSGSDITLADFWGIQSDSKFADDKGTSALIVNTALGKYIIHGLNIDVYETSIESVASNNRCYFKSTHKPDNRVKFMQALQKKTVVSSIIEYGKPSLKETIRFLLIQLAILLRIVTILKRICRRKNE